MILSEKVVEQSVDRSDRGRFVKQLVLVDGTVPLAMVRKRSYGLGGQLGGHRAPVLLVHGYGQNRYAWHLPLRSVSNFLAREGYDVFNLDLRGHGRSAHLGASAPSSIIDYAQEDVPAAVAQIQKISGGRPVFLVGHSLGGLVCYAAAPALGAQVAGVAAIGSPYHFLQGLRGLARLGAMIDFLIERLESKRQDWALDHRIVGELVRNFRMFIDSPLYPLPFRGYDPTNIEPDVLSQHMALAMDAGSIRVLRQMYHEARGRGGRSDVPGGIGVSGEAFEAMTDTPLLVIAGSHDDLAAPAGVRTAYERSHAADKTYRCVPAGHLDLLVGREAPRTTWAILAAWLGRRSR